MRWTWRAAFISALAVATSCRFDPAYRDVGESLTTACTPGASLCHSGKVVTCGADGETLTTVDDCAAKNLACAPLQAKCTVCAPGATQCDGQGVETCAADGSAWTATMTCDADMGIACRGGLCVNL